jgi:hypothetical protein
MKLLASTISAMLSAFLLTHVALIFLSAIPNNPIKNSFFPRIQSPYENGVFKQNWSFFAPLPVNSNEIFTQCSNDGISWTPKKGLLESYLKSSFANPLSSFERISLLLKDVIDEIAWKIKRKEDSSTILDATFKQVLIEQCVAFKLLRAEISSNEVVPFSKRDALRRQNFKLTQASDQTSKLGQWRIDQIGKMNP